LANLPPNGRNLANDNASPIVPSMSSPDRATFWEINKGRGGLLRRENRKLALAPARIQPRLPLRPREIFVGQWFLKPKPAVPSNTRIWKTICGKIFAGTNFRLKASPATPGHHQTSLSGDTLPSPNQKKKPEMNGGLPQKERMGRISHPPPHQHGGGWLSKKRTPLQKNSVGVICFCSKNPGN